MANDPDALLMMQVRDGNDAAFDGLMNRYKKPLMNFIFRMVQDSSLAEELAQDVFVRIYLARKRYRPDAKFSTWMFSIATNTTLKHIRKNRRLIREVDLQNPHDPEAPFFDSVPGSSDAHQVLQEKELLLLLQQALASLPGKERAALALRKDQGCSYQEIADIMRCSVGAIKTYIHRGKLRLREVFALPPARLDSAPERQAANDL